MCFFFHFLFFWSKIKSRFTHCYWLLCLFRLPQSKTSYNLASSWNWILWIVYLSWRMAHISDSSVSSIHDYIQVRHFWQEHQIGDVLHVTLPCITRRSDRLSHCWPWKGRPLVMIIRSLTCRSRATAFSFFPIVFFLWLY